ncbi:intein-containing DNA-directed RNA polymerase subunit A'', partial [Candidatus Woesearchaeota archaeon]|nr:intein-containing DNA-directed RNA polymerase subunit A'' [Candidatus Woesearchaeota archaeon]
MEEAFKKYEGLLPESVLEEVRANLPQKISDAKLREVLDRVYKEYCQMKAEPGESVGLVSAESIGEPGTQMSLDYGEKVIVKTEKGIRTVKIGEFIDKAFETFNPGKINRDSEALPTNAEIRVPALSQDEKVEWKKITALSRHKSPEKLLRITTRSGRKITATPYHSFVIRQNNRIIPVSGSELNKGERIPVVRELRTEKSTNSIELSEYLPKEKYIYSSELKKAIEAGNSRIKRDFISP